VAGRHGTCARHVWPACWPLVRSIEASRLLLLWMRRATSRDDFSTAGKMTALHHGCWTATLPVKESMTGSCMVLRGKFTTGHASLDTGALAIAGIHPKQ
jgi:hypothetical protein